MPIVFLISTLYLVLRYLVTVVVVGVYMPIVKAETSPFTKVCCVLTV